MYIAVLFLDPDNGEVGYSYKGPFDNLSEASKWCKIANAYRLHHEYSDKYPNMAWVLQSMDRANNLERIDNGDD